MFGGVGTEVYVGDHETITQTSGKRSLRTWKVELLG